MSRSGYTDDIDDNWAHIMWRGRVASAMRGKRGQAFLREMLAAMDAMPVKRLVAHELEAGGEVCAIGAVGRARGIDMNTIDPEDYDTVSGVFGIAAPMAQEIVYINDEVIFWSQNPDGSVQRDDDGWVRATPEERFVRMRAWVVRQIKEDAAPVKEGE